MGKGRRGHVGAGEPAHDMSWDCWAVLGPLRSEILSSQRGQYGRLIFQIHLAFQH